MKILNILLLLILLGLFGTSSYLFYLVWPSKATQLIKINGSQEDTLDNFNISGNVQFYKNMRFPDKEITYKFEDKCQTKKKEQVSEAFDIIASKTILKFLHSQENGEITITCSELPPEPEQKGHFIAGEGGPTEIINTSLYAVILAGKISLFRPERCERPNIEIHEILHALGFDHNSNKNSILYPILDCSQKIDDYIINELNALYLQKSLPDLKIKELNASKSKIYLNFHIEIINQGLKNSENATLGIYSNGKLVNNFDLGPIEIGTTKIFEVNNLKVKNSLKNFVFTIDKENKIEEILENNNEISLRT